MVLRQSVHEHKHNSCLTFILQSLEDDNQKQCPEL